MTDKNLRQRVNVLNWLIPLTLFLLFVFFYLVFFLGPARWLKDESSGFDNNGVLVLFYAVVGPLLVFLALRQINLWLGEFNESRSQVEADTVRSAQIAIGSVDAILSLDSQGRIDTWNDGAERLFGFEAAIVRGHPFADLMGGTEAAHVESRWLLEEVQQTGFVRGHETTFLAADGRRIEVEATATLLKIDNGRPAGMSFVMRDITRRKRREEESKQLNTSLNHEAAERNHELAVKVQELGQANRELQKLDQTRSEFVSLVSHQIRAPLTNMGGAVQRMQMDCTEINPTCARMFTIFEQQVDRLDRLVQDVLNASHLEAGEVSLLLEPISLLPVVRQAADEIRTGAVGRSIQLSEKPGLPLVYADRDRVAEVLANLLDNADKYSPPGKEISIQLRADQMEVTVVVGDAGPGIPSKDLDRIFDKFYRTDSTDAQIAYGYGLGLYVCRRLIEAQGGRIWAENQPEGGAMFSFAIPVWQEKND